MQVLRPINVAHKNKWLRDTSRDLDKTIDLNLLSQQGYSRIESSYVGAQFDHLRLIKARIQEFFALPEFINSKAEKIMSKVLEVTKKDSFETIHDLVSCYILSIKLYYGLNDVDTNEYRDFIWNLKAVLSGKSQTNIFWRL